MTALCSPGTESSWDDGHWVSQLRAEVENRRFKTDLNRATGSSLMIHTSWWTWQLTFVHYILLTKTIMTLQFDTTFN